MSNDGLQQLFEESVSAVTATNSVQLGTERWHDGDRYRYMYNKGASTATVGQVVGLIGSGGSTVSSLYSFTVDTVAGTSDCIGVVKNADISNAYYGWVLQEGYVSFDTVTSASTAGYGLGVGADGDVDTASNTTGTIVGEALESVSTAGCGCVGRISI
jgi:hypothetical protein